MLTDLDFIECSQWLWAQFAQHMPHKLDFLSGINEGHPVYTTVFVSSI